MEKHQLKTKGELNFRKFELFEVQNISKTKFLILTRMFQQSFKFNFTLECYNFSLFEDESGYDLSCDGLRFSELKNGNQGGNGAFGNFGGNKPNFNNNNLHIDKTGKYAGLEGFSRASFNVRIGF